MVKSMPRIAKGTNMTTESDWTAEGKKKQLEGEIHVLKGKLEERPDLEIAGAIEKGIGKLQEDLGKIGDKIEREIAK